MYLGFEEVEKFAKEKGCDVHTALACFTHDVNPEDVTPEMRQWAKSVNYYSLYAIPSAETVKSFTQATQAITGIAPALCRLIDAMLANLDGSKARTMTLEHHIYMDRLDEVVEQAKRKEPPFWANDYRKKGRRRGR